MAGKPLIWGYFFAQKSKFILFFKCDCLISMQYQKQALKIYLKN